MKELLPLFKNPTHYLGCELNSVHKSEDTPVKWALAFPDLYPVGVSYFGHQILYWILNKHPDIWAQRVYAPSKEVGEILKKYNTPLATLEGDMPLHLMDVIGFSITHELCYTTILYMLDLANIPFYSEERTDPFPLIIAGGESTFNPNPIRDFFDAFVIGDGEEIVIDISNIILKAKKQGKSKEEILIDLSNIEGIYVPFFGKKKIKKRLYNKFNREDFPIKQIVPFGKPVHDRYVIEITKGCSRGCRFCFAGMVSRPVRERNIDSLGEILDKGLILTGYEDVGFLSLSVGDFSLLDELFSIVLTRCEKEHLSLSLPSLRAGTIPEPLLKHLGRLKKTGLTLAPEAGTQRLRDVINKGITEKDILNHTRWAFENGWQKIKLYFMIGLPTETKEDLDGILELCLKILKSAPKNFRRINVSASISPFVPKPHTPFQWERQNTLEEIREKIGYLRKIFRPYKKLKLSWPILEMSIIEGVFSRGDSNLCKAIERAYFAGDVFTSWKEYFNYSLWLDVFKDLAIDFNGYLAKREEEDILPWDFIDTGVNKEFLKKERERAKKAENTPDCRWGKCSGCGVCDFKEVMPLINSREKSIKKFKIDIQDKEVNFSKKWPYLFWFEKIDRASFLSQLELQRVIERIMRRAKVPMAFSKGYSPRPKMSFGRALPVGVWSLNEYVLVQVLKRLDSNIVKVLNKSSINGIKFTHIEFRRENFNVPLSSKELFKIRFSRNQADFIKEFRSAILNDLVVEKKSSTIPLKDLIKEWKIEDNEIYLLFDWTKIYINPLTIIRTIYPKSDMLDFCLIKQKQFF